MKTFKQLMLESTDDRVIDAIDIIKSMVGKDIDVDPHLADKIVRSYHKIESPKNKEFFLNTLASGKEGIQKVLKWSEYLERVD